MKEFEGRLKQGGFYSLVEAISLIVALYFITLSIATKPYSISLPYLNTECLYCCGHVHRTGGFASTYFYLVLSYTNGLSSQEFAPCL